MDKTIIRIIFGLLFVSFLAGCGTITTNEYMKVTTDASQLKPAEGKALIIFQRERSAIARIYSANLWDLTNKKSPEIIGHMDSGMKVAYQVPAGNYQFVNTLTGAAQLMKAKVKAGKTYFVELQMSVGDGLVFRPVKAGQDNHISMENITLPDAQLKQWAKRTENVNSALNTLNKALVNWNKLSEDEKRQSTMSPEDGV